MERMYFGIKEALDYAKTHKISNIIQMGDFFDDRNSLGLPVIHMANAISDMIAEYDGHFYILLGNHDVHYKNRNDVNSPMAIFADSKNIRVIDRNCTFFGVDFIPWINHQNYDEAVEFISSSKSSFCVGHFELSGFPFHKGGRESDDGMKSSLFANYSYVFSGHYHTRSKKGNIEYVGSSSELTWADWDDPKGFTVFDMADGSTNFVPLKNAVNFVKLIMNENGEVTESIPEVPTVNRYVRVIVEGKPGKEVEEAIKKIETDALTMEVYYSEEIVVDKTVTIKEVSIDTLIEDVVTSSVENEDIRPAVIKYIDMLYKEASQ
jgi:DNA repair exonuclease SbcCD nuclease subunit